MSFRAGSAKFVLWAASQRGYFKNRRADNENHGKVGFWPIQRAWVDLMWTHDTVRRLTE